MADPLTKGQLGRITRGRMEGQMLIFLTFEFEEKTTSVLDKPIRFIYKYILKGFSEPEGSIKFWS